MCGIIGIVARGAVNQSLFDGLTVLQHRGQDAAGIVTCDEGRLFLRKDNGLVRDRGNMGIGHVRYPTAGCSSSAEAQPFYVNSPFGITLAHNGNLTNAEQLKKELFREDLRHINTDSDSEVLLNVFAHELQAQGKLTIDQDDIFNAVAGGASRVRSGSSPPRAWRWTPWVMSWCATSLPARRCSSIWREDSIRGSVLRTPSTPPVSSSMSISPGRTHSSTGSRSTSRACAWETCWHARSGGSFRNTTSTW